MLDKESQDLTTAREICDKFNTPFDTTAKVMQIMASQGLMNSLKGVKGGYTLSSDLSQISFLALSEMIEGKTFTMDCESSKCEFFGTCNITAPIKRLNEYLEVFFNNLSLKELLTSHGPITLGRFITQEEHAQ